MKKKSIILLFILVVFVLSGCHAKKEERFPDVDEVISDQQINIRFAWKEN